MLSASSDRSPQYATASQQRACATREPHSLLSLTLHGLHRLSSSRISAIRSPSQQKHMRQTCARPILVTGSHRSGTTWVGHIIRSVGRIGYIHEPFNKDYHISWAARPMTHWYFHVASDDESLRVSDIHDIVTFRYPLRQNLLRARSARDVARALKHGALALRYRCARCRPLLKDPLALFSCEWLAKTFNMHVVMMIRHPAAFCSSLKIKRWAFPFADLDRQPQLMTGILSPYAEKVARAADGGLDTIDQGILLWNCVHHVIKAYQQRHEDWCFVCHERLSRDPIAGFGAIFERLGLAFTGRVRRAVEASSGKHNPVEQVAGREFIRNSSASVTNWKSRLELEEIQRIRIETADVAASFYTDADW